jgi:hypothetical protein
MGQKVSLTETFTGTGLPTVYDDSIMSAGSLILMDVGHSLGGFTGIPASGTAIPNVAWSTANALVAGAPGQAALSGVVFASDTMASGVNTSNSVTFPFTERTPKKGLHIVRSQVNDVANKTYNFQAPASIQTYLYNNQTHAYYFSLWQYFTRAFTTGGSPFPGLGIVGQNTSIGFLGYTPANGTDPIAPGTNKLGTTAFIGSEGLATGASFIGNGVSQWTGTAPASASNINVDMFIWGGQGGPFSGLHVGGSQIFYRCYFEDLTVSAAAGGYAGGSAITVAQRYAELVARDQALYNAAFASGGKFNGDTFTNPSLYP